MKLEITQRRSVIGRTPGQRRTMRALGLRKIGHSVRHDDNPTIRGMIFKVAHLIQVQEMEDGR